MGCFGQRENIVCPIILPAFAPPIVCLAIHRIKNHPLFFRPLFPKALLWCVVFWPLFRSLFLLGWACAFFLKIAYTPRSSGHNSPRNSLAESAFVSLDVSTLCASHEPTPPLSFDSNTTQASAILAKHTPTPKVTSPSGSRSPKISPHKPFRCSSAYKSLRPRLLKPPHALAPHNAANKTHLPLRSHNANKLPAIRHHIQKKR